MRLLKPWGPERLCVNDVTFDRIYPEEQRERSSLHWTPIPVVQRAMELLGGDNPRSRILDVGSGVGKFCLAGSLLSRASFVGIEQRPHFVELSRELARKHGIERVRFVNVNLIHWDWRGFTGIYLFNPFQENLTLWERIDSTVELGRDRFAKYVEHTREKLLEMPEGTRVVTYHGFGGTIPGPYHRVTREFCHRGPLECWEKRTGSGRRFFHV